MGTKNRNACAAVVFCLALGAGTCIIAYVRAVSSLPLWTYAAFFATLVVALLAIWTLATGMPPSWNVPPAEISPLVSLHPRLFFWQSWKEINRQTVATAGRAIGYEVIVVTLTVAFSLTLVEYFGDRAFVARLWPKILTGYYADLAVFAWWSVSRFVGYVVIPIISVFLTPALSLRHCGLGTSGFARHLWVYAVLLLIVLPVIVFISFQQDFKEYYPFYDYASRSWFDFLAWELLYAVQFVSLEFLFRGYMLHPLKKSLGAYSIFLMVIPYCMIHYGKPYLEPNAAIVAGVVLGTLSLRTGSIWCGCLIHISVALAMDLAALTQKGLLDDLMRAPWR